MKNLIFVFSLIFCVQNFTFASVSYNYDYEDVASLKSKTAKKEKTKSPKKTNDAILNVEIGYYIVFGGLMMQVISLLLSINPTSAAIVLIIGLLIALIGLLIIGFSLIKIKKNLKN